MSAARYSPAGLGILALLVVFAAAWMHLQSRRNAAALPVRATQPALTSVTVPGFVGIPAGDFRMGSDPRADRMAYANERWSQDAYQGRINLPLFYIGRSEVTTEQFSAFVNAAGYRAEALSLTGEGALPVVHVSWTDALAYARWLMAALKAAPSVAPRLAALLNDGWSITLPSEAQWEKAARGDDGRVFPWGNTPDKSKANIDSSGRVAVGRIACDDCSYGLADMSGNVWELTRSPYQDYPWQPADDGEVTGDDALYVMRGGSYSDAINNARSATRGGVDPGARRPNIGFRLVLTRE